MQRTLTPTQLEHVRSIPPAAFANRVRLVLTMLGLTQADAAEGAGINPSTMSQIVNGRHADVRVDTGRRLAQFFGCTIEDLFPAAHVPQSDASAEGAPHDSHGEATGEGARS